MLRKGLIVIAVIFSLVGCEGEKAIDTTGRAKPDGTVTAPTPPAQPAGVNPVTPPARGMRPPQ